MDGGPARFVPSSIAVSGTPGTLTRLPASNPGRDHDRGFGTTRTKRSIDRRSVLIATLLGLTLTMAACAEPAVDAGAGTSPAAPLDRNRELWAASAPSDYRYTVERQCFCGQEFTGPFTVTVEDGAIVTVTRRGKEIAVDDEWLLEIPVGIEGLFGHIEKAQAEADEVHVTYDEQLGYPRSIAIDWYANAIDDEMTIVVSGFRG